MDRYAAELAARLRVVVPAAARELGGPRYLARYVRYPRALRAEPPVDLVHVVDHSYAHCLAAFPGAPSVLTVHDLYPLRVLREHGGGLRAAVRNSLLRRTMRWVRHADRLVTVSHAVAGEIPGLLGVPADRVRVAPNGVAAAFFVTPPPETTADLRRAWLSGADPGGARILLHVGLCTPRKRVELAIAALAELRRRGTDARLVQIGGRFTPEHRAAIAAAGLVETVRQDPAVSEAALVAAYHAADALIMPSADEGFGLPVLEALAAGLAVVTSGAGGLREAGGAAALVAGADTPAGYADALLEAWSDPDRAGRAERGRAHARAHSWDRTAGLVREVYAELGVSA